MGYSQIHGLEYNEVFSPTLRLEKLRLIFSLMAIKKCSGQQVDFKTVFLNGKLDKQIFMEQPPGFEDQHHPDYVCEVKQSLYGLKQALRQWNLELHNALIDLGLACSNYDPTLYYKIKDNKLLGAISIHVDDLCVIGDDSWVSVIIAALGLRFKIGADEELAHFLSPKITQDFDKKLVFLNQSHYIKDLWACFLPGNQILVTSPANDTFKDLKKREDNEDQSGGPYPQLIGRLLWLAQFKRPDIAFVVNQLSQFIWNPSNSHWLAAVQVLQYVISTKSLKLCLGGDMEIAGYSDSDWAEDCKD